MYSYEFDKETGGLILSTTPYVFSKEPRPVYSRELDLLGFNKYFKYEKQEDLPYMWAEATKYYYYGELVAQIKGGNLYSAPELEVIESNIKKLKPVDVNKMLEKNKEFLNILEQETVKRVYEVWKKHKSKLDIFHVAFSGGKDSLVLLDLVKKALPKDSFVVVFGDTQMEFPDTYKVVDEVEEECKKEGIKFYRAKSHLDVYKSWEAFGPPSRVLRWCCSVHKSTPQVVKLREVLNKDDYQGLAYVGVRGQESAKRSEYDYESYGAKQKGQRSANPILDWSSAEIWLHIYKNDLIINGAYKKGSTRAGCLCCPMGGGKDDYFRCKNYNNETNKFIDIIKDSNNRERISNEEYLMNGGWNARNNGQYLKNNTDIKYNEITKKDELIIEISNPKTDWKEWIKTLGTLQKNNDGNYTIIAKELVAEFEIKEIKNGYIVTISNDYLKKSAIFSKYFRQVFRKTTYCIGCKTCEVNCRRHCISFKNNILKIENCIQCRECHAINTGCLNYDSLRITKGENIKMKGINSFATHAPKTEWLNDFFERQEDFLQNNSLGVMQKPVFNRFLRDANLIQGNSVTKLTKILKDLGWDNKTSLGVILSNVSYNTQFEWYIKNMELDYLYSRKELQSKIINAGYNDRTARDVVGDFKRITSTPLGTVLNFGYVDDDDNYSRNRCYIDSPLVILYSLYKYAEKCNGLYEFTLSRLYNFEIESDGISPAQIFGTEKEEMVKILSGLSAKYPKFINVTFTLDLERINLRSDKKSEDVIDLLEVNNG